MPAVSQVRAHVPGRRITGLALQWTLGKHWGNTREILGKQETREGLDTVRDTGLDPAQPPQLTSRLLPAI